MKFAMIDRRLRPIGVASLAIAFAALAVNDPALAQRQQHQQQHRPGRSAAPSHWRGDISRFHEHDWGVWRGGRWVHDRHDGRLGWWWVAGGLWYLYPSPIYPYPSPWAPPVTMVVPPAAAVPPVPPTQYWYFCEAARTYYPYVATCPGGWKEVPATPADASTPRN